MRLVQSGRRQWLVLPLILLSLLIATSAQAINVLVILPANYGTNLFLNWNYMQELGWDVTLTGTADPVPPCTWARDRVIARTCSLDVLIDDIEDVTQYDAIIVSFGSNLAANPCGDLINSDATLNLLYAADQAGIVIAGMCGAVRVLAAADVIDGHHITGKEYYQDEYVAAGAIYDGPELAPIIDGNIVTCTRGMYYYMQNIDAVQDAIYRNLPIDRQTQGGQR